MRKSTPSAGGRAGIHSPGGGVLHPIEIAGFPPRRIGPRAHGAAISAALILAALLCIRPGGAAAIDKGRLLAQYMDNPAGNRRAVRALGRDGIGHLDSGTVLLIADANLRSGNATTAAQLFSLVLARGEGQPVIGIAAAGLGSAALAQGDLVTARVQFQQLLTAEGSAGAPGAHVTLGLPGLGRLALGLLDAYEGRGLPAALSLDHLAGAPGTDPVLRPVARLGAAYARYWAGDFAGAATAFDFAAREYPDAPTADDARYAAAWSRWRGGERDRGLEDLHTEARQGNSNGRRARASREMIYLEPQEVIRAGLRGGRHPMGMPVQRFAWAFDLDGARLARAALRLLERDDGGERPVEEPGVVTIGFAPPSRVVDRASSSTGAPDKAIAPVDEEAADADGGGSPFLAGLETKRLSGEEASVSNGSAGAAQPSSSAAPTRAGDERSALLWLAFGLLAVGIVAGALHRHGRRMTDWAMGPKTKEG